MNEYPLCNWQVAIKDEDGDVVTDEVGRDTFQDCGLDPVAIYFKKNPERRSPDQPTYLTYPACKRHDTKPRRQAADDLGYDRETL